MQGILRNKILLAVIALAAVIVFFPSIFGDLYLPSISDVQYCVVDPMISNPMAITFAGLVLYFVFEHGHANTNRLTIAAAVVVVAAYVTTNYFC